MENILKKYLAYDGMVKVVLVNGTKMVSEARNIHNLSNVTTAALGRTLIMTAIMSSKLKDKDNRITVQIKGDGPIGSIVTCGNSNLDIKGYVSVPDVELPLNDIGKLDVAKAVGKGYLNVIKDIGLKEPYIGYSNLVTSEIAEDFAYYFVTSEQTPCAVALGVNISKENKVDMAAGYIIEPLPDCSDIIESINMNISSVTGLMMDLDNMDDVAKTITGDNNIVCIEELNPSYKCDCSTSRIDKTIIALGKDEAFKILEENKLKHKTNSRFYSLLAQYYFVTEDYDKALENVNEFDKYEKNSPLTYQMRALIYENKKDEYNAHLNWGKYNLIRKNTDIAINEYLIAHQIKDDDVNLLTTLAVLLEENGDKNHSIEFYEKIASLEPNNIKALEKLADFRNSIGDYGMECDYLEKWYEADKRNYALIKRLAEAYARAKNKPSAVEFYKKYLQVAPNSEDYDKVKKALNKIENSDMVEDEGFLEKIIRFFSKS